MLVSAQYPQWIRKKLKPPWWISWFASFLSLALAQDLVMEGGLSPLQLTGVTFDNVAKVEDAAERVIFFCVEWLDECEESSPRLESRMGNLSERICRGNWRQLGTITGSQHIPELLAGTSWDQLGTAVKLVHSSLEATMKRVKHGQTSAWYEEDVGRIRRPDMDRFRS
eukprot:Skav228791  [mRNA]  locus=scaffold589:719735:721498:- [translate_table: standard]